jgi:hypothetical protein
MTTDAAPHHPEYVYCSDPETCCWHWWPVVIVCAVDGQRWPCETKRAHHTEAHAARVKRWADGRIGRPPKTQTVETP